MDPFANKTYMILNKKIRKITENEIFFHNIVNTTLLHSKFSGDFFSGRAKKTKKTFTILGSFANF